MQPRLNANQMTGKTIKQFILTSSDLLIEVEGGGYIVIEARLDWDDGAELRHGDDLEFKQQFAAGLIAEDEYITLLTEENAKNEALKAKRVIESAEAAKGREKAEMYNLMLKYPKDATAFVQAPNVSPHVDYNGGRVCENGGMEGSAPIKPGG